MRRTLAGRELNADEIIDILKAWLNPSQRKDRKTAGDSM
jgi:hypothetical protein